MTQQPEQYGVRHSDGSISRQFNGRTSRQRCEELIAEWDAIARDMGRESAEMTLVRRIGDGPWRKVIAFTP